MAQVIGQRSTNQAITETRLVRQVADEIGLLEPNQAPLVTMLMRLKKRVPIKSPRWEWFEDDYVARWAVNGVDTINAVTTSTTVTVTDGSLFVAGDLFVIPKLAGSSAMPEVMRVTAVTGNVLTVVRNIGGTALDTMLPGGALRIIGNAFEEGAPLPVAKTTAPSKLITYTQIFRTTCKFTKTQVASQVYGAPSGDRVREHKKKLIEHKSLLNSALLFGQASENLTGGPSGQPIRTTMGLLSAIKTNLTDAGGTLTKKVFEAWSRQSFRYGAQTKMLLACPLLKSAINEWSREFLMVTPGENKYGVKVQTVETAHGTWLLVNDWMLESGVSGQNGFGNIAFSVDVDQLRYVYLSNNGVDRDTHLTEDAEKAGADYVIDEILTEGGFAIQQEQYHSRLFNITDYQS